MNENQATSLKRGDNIIVCNSKNDFADVKLVFIKRIKKQLHDTVYRFQKFQGKSGVWKIDCGIHDFAEWKVDHNLFSDNVIIQHTNK